MNVCFLARAVERPSPLSGSYVPFSGPDRCQALADEGRVLLCCQEGGRDSVWVVPFGHLGGVRLRKPEPAGDGGLQRPVTACPCLRSAEPIKARARIGLRRLPGSLNALDPPRPSGPVEELLARGQRRPRLHF